MSHVSAQGVDERMMNVHHYYLFLCVTWPVISSHALRECCCSHNPRLGRVNSVTWPPS